MKKSVHVFFTKISWEILEMWCKNRIINPAPTNLKCDENCAGTDGESNHSHEGTHDKVWMKNLFLQRDRERTQDFIITDTVKSKEKLQFVQANEHWFLPQSYAASLEEGPWSPQGVLLVFGSPALGIT